MADLRDVIIEAYQEYIRIAPVNTELRKALKAHERVPNFVLNLVKEFSSSKGSKFGRETIRKATFDMTKLFINCIETRANERRMSDLEKMIIKQEANRKSEMISLADQLNAKGETNVTEDKPGTETERQTAVID